MVAQVSSSTNLAKAMTAADWLRLRHCEGFSLEDLGRLIVMGHTVEVRYRGIHRMSGGPATEHFFCVDIEIYCRGFGVIAELVGLGHDLLEDGVMTIAETRATFGKWVAICIRALSKRPEDHGNLVVYARRMLRAVRRGFWQVIVAKIADRVHNLRTLDGFASTDRQREYLTETEDIILTLAEVCRPWVAIHAPDKLAAYDELCAALWAELTIQRERLGVVAT